MATKETKMVIGDCGINFNRKQNKTLNFSMKVYGKSKIQELRNGR